MAASRTEVGATRTSAVDAFEREGCSGSILFHTRDGDVALTAGDRLDLEPGTEHAATVGPDGCGCVEASR
jgi:hypothetical protein